MRDPYHHVLPGLKEIAVLNIGLGLAKDVAAIARRAGDEIMKIYQSGSVFLKYLKYYKNQLKKEVYAIILLDCLVVEKPHMPIY